MKHWDGRDLAQSAPRRLSPRDRQRLAELFEAPVRPRRGEPQIGSVLGLVLALGVLAGVAWMLAPSSPVSPDLLN